MSTYLDLAGRRLRGRETLSRRGRIMRLMDAMKEDLQMVSAIEGVSKGVERETGDLLWRPIMATVEIKC